MKAFFYDENGNIVDIAVVLDTADLKRCIMAEDYPPYQPKDGFSGKLAVRDGALIWEYAANPVNNEVSPEELNNMVEEVL